MKWPWSTPALPSPPAPARPILSYHSSSTGAPGEQLGSPKGAVAASNPRMTKKQIKLENKEKALLAKATGEQQAAERTKARLIGIITKIIQAEAAVKPFEKVYENQASFAIHFDAFIKDLETKGFKQPVLCRDRSYSRNFAFIIFKTLVSTKVIRMSTEDILDSLENDPMAYLNQQSAINAPQPTIMVPQHTMNAPQPAMNAPQPAINASQPTWNAPQPTINASQPTWNAPQPTINASQPTWNAPQPTINASQPTWNAPQPTINAPQPTIPVPAVQPVPVSQRGPTQISRPAKRAASNDTLQPAPKKPNVVQSA